MSIDCPDTRECKNYNYSADPANNDSDAARFLVGDTNPARPLLNDSEVEWALEQAEGNPYGAAVILADSISAMFSSMADISVGPVSKSFSKVAEMMQKKADELRRRDCLLAAPSFPAIKRCTKESLASNNSLTSPQFSIGFGDNRFAVQLNGFLDSAGYRGDQY